MFQPQSSTFWSLNIHSFSNCLLSVAYVLSNVLGAEVITVNRYSCSHGTYILVNISGRTFLSSWLVCPLILWQHATHCSCLVQTLHPPRGPQGHTPSEVMTSFFLQASMCPTCTFVTILLLPGLRMRYVQNVKAINLDLDSGERLRTRSASLSDDL